ncbi:hypothetical protein J4G07_04945 [Candidatus Poribacteria bacterium]|nr:hypothetical protein [Candidatus Poribacteria bacterium]
MQTHVVELTKQRLSDFFVKEDGHVAHKNAFVAGTVATGAIFASMLLAPDITEANHGVEGEHYCGDDQKHTHCKTDTHVCCSGDADDGGVRYFCAPKRDGCPA